MWRGEDVGRGRIRVAQGTRRVVPGKRRGGWNFDVCMVRGIPRGQSWKGSTNQ